MSGRDQRHPRDKQRPASLDLRQLQIAAVRARHLPRQVEAKAGATGIAGARGIGTVERLADAGALVRRDARSVVANAELQVLAGGWRDDKTGPMQVVSGPLGRERVHYEALPAARVGTDMDEFLAWFNGESAIDPVLKAAVAHWGEDAGWRRVRPPLVELDGTQNASLVRDLEAAGFSMPGLRDAR